MSRVVKDADVRRKELLDTALELFERVGYERASVGEITAMVGVAKGTFYHYFTSKQDLLEQLVTSWADELFAQLEVALRELDGDALRRLRGLFQLSSSFKLERRETAEAFGRSLYSDDNLRLRHALMSGWAARTQEMMAGIIAEGAASGVFDVADPAGTAAAVSSLWFGWSDGQAERMVTLPQHPELLPDLVGQVRAVETAMERILGIEAGTLMLGLDTILEQFMEDR